jgi:hypothetical protein
VASPTSPLPGVNSGDQGRVARRCLEAGTVSADKALMRYGSTVDRWERFGHGPTHRRERVT